MKENRVSNGGRFFSALLMLIVSAGLLGAGPAAAEGYGKQKVVYHINDVERAKAAFRNVTNHFNAVGDDNLDVVVVLHSSGGRAVIDGETDSKGNRFDSSIQQLANRGVRFQLCENTINGLKLDRDAINLNVEVVPAGVAQLAKLQQEGYVYIKP